MAVLVLHVLAAIIIHNYLNYILSANLVLKPWSLKIKYSFRIFNQEKRANLILLPNALNSITHKCLASNSHVNLATSNNCSRAVGTTFNFESTVHMAKNNYGKETEGQFICNR